MALASPLETTPHLSQWLKARCESHTVPAHVQPQDAQLGQGEQQPLPAASPPEPNKVREVEEGGVLACLPQACDTLWLKCPSSSALSEKRDTPEERQVAWNGQKHVKGLVSTHTHTAILCMSRMWFRTTSSGTQVPTQKLAMHRVTHGHTGSSHSLEVVGRWLQGSQQVVGQQGIVPRFSQYVHGVPWEAWRYGAGHVGAPSGAQGRG